MSDPAPRAAAALPGAPSTALCTDLAGKAAVLTGAAGGIGRAIAQALLARGATVHGLDHRAEALATAAAALPGFVPHPVNLADRADTDRVVRELRAGLNARCDILINNAGISSVLAFDETPDSMLDLLFAVNFHAAFRLTRGLLPALAAAPGACVVNIASELALVGQQGYSAYSATKGAVLAWTRTLAVELAPQRVRVNAVCPGPIDTAMLGAEFALAPDPGAARTAETALVPLGRLGRPEDIGAVVAFLASDAAGFVTGAVWAVDGGKTAQ